MSAYWLLMAACFGMAVLASYLPSRFLGWSAVCLVLAIGLRGGLRGGYL